MYSGDENNPVELLKSDILPASEPDAISHINSVRLTQLITIQINIQPVDSIRAGRSSECSAGNAFWVLQ